MLSIWLYILLYVYIRQKKIFWRILQPNCFATLICHFLFSTDKRIQIQVKQYRFGQLYELSFLGKLCFQQPPLWQWKCAAYHHINYFVWFIFTCTFMHLADAFLFPVSVFPGNWTHNLCAANAMLYHWATGTQIYRSTLISLSILVSWWKAMKNGLVLKTIINMVPNRLSLCVL